MQKTAAATTPAATAAAPIPMPTLAPTEIEAAAGEAVELGSADDVLLALEPVDLVGAAVPDEVLSAEAVPEVDGDADELGEAVFVSAVAGPEMVEALLDVDGDGVSEVAGVLVSGGGGALVGVGVSAGGGAVAARPVLVKSDIGITLPHVRAG